LWHEFRRTDRVSSLVIEELLRVLVGEFAKQPAPAAHRGRQGWLDTVTEFIHANVRGGVTLGDVARAGSVHPMHLVRAFRQRHGCSVGEYVRRCRVRWACSQLEGSEIQELSLSRLAAEAGFADHAHFTRVFKRVTGIAPSTYRSYLLPG
jgi:AraC family transcriptional regulator